MIGIGRDRSNLQTTNGHGVAALFDTQHLRGRLWSSTQDIRWGTNVIDQGSLAEGIGMNSETTFITSFSRRVRLTRLKLRRGILAARCTIRIRQAALWSLAGIMASSAPLGNQPWGTSVFGDTTSRPTCRSIEPRFTKPWPYPVTLTSTES